jgi:D-sedoheptulose 7-phosphate isomerase
MSKPGLEIYVATVLSALQEEEDSIQEAVNAVRVAKETNGRIWVLGNGGSLAIAQHFAQDILKTHGVRAQCLNDPSVLTAYANDNGFSEAFFGPLSKLIQPEDLIIAFSCSGKSSNYSLIFNHMTNKKIAIVGTAGGFMKDTADVCVHVKSKDYKVCEAAFGIVADLINIGLED